MILTQQHITKLNSKMNQSILTHVCINIQRYMYYSFVDELASTLENQITNIVGADIVYQLRYKSYLDNFQAKYN